LINAEFTANIKTFEYSSEGIHGHFYDYMALYYKYID